MLDGNRRWAKAVGADTAHGYQAGAANIEPLLDWCEEVGVKVVTLWLLSTDNLNRPPEQLAGLLSIIEGAVATLAEAGRWRLHPVGALDLLPASTAAKLKAAEEARRTRRGCCQRRRGVRRPPRDRGRRTASSRSRPARG